MGVDRSLLCALVCVCVCVCVVCVCVCVCACTGEVEVLDVFVCVPTRGEPERDAVYWPGMVEDIKLSIVNCTVCEIDSPAQSNESQLTCSISREKVDMDLFSWKEKEYLNSRLKALGSN